MSALHLFSDLISPKCRPESPARRLPETRASTCISPNSPLSPAQPVCLYLIVNNEGRVSPLTAK